MTKKRKVGRPRGSTTKDPATATEQNATFVVRKDLLGKIKLLAQADSYRQTVEDGQMVTVKLKDVVNQALDQYVNKYERKYGKL